MKWKSQHHSHLSKPAIFLLPKNKPHVTFRHLQPPDHRHFPIKSLYIPYQRRPYASPKPPHWMEKKSASVVWFSTDDNRLLTWEARRGGVSKAEACSIEELLGSTAAFQKIPYLPNEEFFVVAGEWVCVNQIRIRGWVVDVFVVTGSSRPASHHHLA